MNNRPTTRRGTILGVAAVLWATAMAGSAARAAPANVEEAAKVLRLNREAMELFDSLDFELARESLLDALKLGEAARLGAHTVMVRTHANLGLVYAVGLKDEGRAVSHFKQALGLRPEYRLPKELAAPEAARAFARAQRELKEPPPAQRIKDEEITALLETAPRADEGGARERSKGSAVSGALKCPTAGEVEAGDEITMRCVTSGELRPTSVILFYKRRGQDDFVSVPMSAASTDARRATWVGRIPGGEVSGRWLPFYFEARDGRGEALALAGRNDSPNIITIRGGAEDEDPEPAALSVRKTRAQDDEENPLLDRRARRRPAAQAGRTWVGLGVGSGAGYAKGNGVEAYHEYVKGFTPGLAAAGLAHAVPELGYFLRPNLALSLQGRVQYIPRQDQYTASGAWAVLGRALFFSDGDRGRFYGALALGGGEGFRLVVESYTTDRRIIKDTVKGGPLVTGGGGGFSYALGETFTWIIEANLLAGVPTFSAVVDVNTGLRASF